MSTRENPFTERLQQFWFSPRQGAKGQGIAGPLRVALSFLALIYRLGWALREVWFHIFAPRSAAGRVRVIAIGNLIVGGAGKTPCALAVARALQDAGIACGLISRGYRAKAPSDRPQVVLPEALAQTPPAQIGDEPWLLAWRSGLPIAVGKNRWQCLQSLLAARPELQAVILDDGLQQRSLASDEQMLVTDERGFGNGRCLPAGPLREPVGDLGRFSLRVHRGQELLLQHGGWVPLGPLAAGQHKAPEWMDAAAGVRHFAGRRILAAAGIAQPQRFFDELQRLGLDFESLALADHETELARILQQHWQSGQYDVVLMTEKDAVKFFNTRLDVCGHAWALRQDPQLDPTLISRLIHGFKTA